MTRLPHNGWLIAGGTLSMTAALAHLAVIVGGPAWYRFFGAGEPMARAAARGAAYPAVATAGIALVLAGFGMLALSGGGVLPRLPLLRVGLVAITGLYLARGAVLFWPALLRRPDLGGAFLFWSSAIVLAIGLVHLIGVWQSWAALKGVT